MTDGGGPVAGDTGDRATTTSAGRPGSGRDLVVSLGMGVTAMLAVRNIDARPFWMDEGASAYLVSGPADRFLERLPYEPQFVLYHCLLRVWSVVGTSEVALRSFSVVLAVATVPIVHATARRLFGDLAAGVAVAVLAVHGFFLGYAQEARPYALAACTSAAVCLCLVRALERPGERRAWVAWAVAALLAMLAHPYGGFVVLAHLYVIATRRHALPWRKIGVVVAVPAVVGAAFGAWLLTIGARRIDWLPPAGLRQYLAVGRELAGGRAVWSLVAYAAGAALVVVRDRRGRTTGAAPVDRPVQVAVACVVVPVVVVAVASLVQPLVFARYLIVVVPPLAVLAAAGVGRLRPAVAVLGTAVLVLVSLDGAWTPIRDELRQDWPLAARVIAAGSSSGDLIVVADVGPSATLYYLERLLPAGSIPFVVRDDRLLEPDRRPVDPCRHATVWAVAVDQLPLAPVSALLAGTHVAAARTRVPGLVVERYDRLATVAPGTGPCA